jgi:hypothetical protein
MAQGASLCQYISAGSDVLSFVLRLLKKKEMLKVFAAFCLFVRTLPINFALLGRKREKIHKIKDDSKIIMKTNLERRGLRPYHLPPS